MSAKKGSAEKLIPWILLSGVVCYFLSKKA